MPSAQEILKQYWGYHSFRPLQQEIIESVIAGNDTLALLPTGGGKSICFQVPALMQDGICIVISPLIALMKDQVQQLNQRGIKATAIHSGMSKRLIDATLDNCVYADYKFLYCSPERIQTKLFQERFAKMNVNLIAVDEAHCISQWGYDFRPPYLKIVDLKQWKPSVPFLAVTATATPQVVIDIQEKLGFEHKNVLQKSFLRSNLSYSVLYEDAKLTKLVDILQKVKGTSIVYVRNRRKTKEYADYLQSCGISATYYHAGLSFEERSQRQEKWINNQVRVMVATNAFGMGIDKPDVRTVVHMDLPDSVEAYFQEAGRAGRDGNKAYAVLLFNLSDKLKLLKELEENMPSIADIKEVYNALGNYFQLAVGSGKNEKFAFNIGEFCQQYHFSVIRTFNVFQFLAQDEYLMLSEAIYQPSKVKVLMSKSALYKFEVEHKQFEPLIKHLLRAHGGIFDGFVNINEQKIAHALATTKDKISKGLHLLNQQEVIAYEAQNREPFIQYLQPRVSSINLTLDTEKINQRKKTFEDKLLAMLDYASSKNECRSNMLLAYFGEERNDRCGICDYCTGRNSLDVSEVVLQNIKQQIKEELKEEAHTPEYLVTVLKEPNKEKILHIIHWLLDHDVIFKDAAGKLNWTSKK